jgi:micrococcal nuclease
MRKIFAALFVLVILLTGCIDSLKQLKYSDNLSESVFVVKVIDGDTIEIMRNGEVEKIRLVGIDTPEPYSENNKKKWYGLPNDHLKKWGVKAKEYTADRVYMKEVNISYDLIQGNKDDYGRTLAYILIDNKNLNLELVENGYARVYTEKKSDLYLKLIEAETKARITKVGLWDYSPQNN